MFILFPKSKMKIGRNIKIYANLRFSKKNNIKIN